MQMIYDFGCRIWRRGRQYYAQNAGIGRSGGQKQTTKKDSVLLLHGLELRDLAVHPNHAAITGLPVTPPTQITLCAIGHLLVSGY
jgi:hypothetical protein